MRFLDRVHERRRLDSLRAPGFAVLWGRRRVGKTRLLVEWCRASKGTYTVADQSAEPVQRRYFAETLAARLPGFADVVYPDWRSLLRAIARETERGALRGPLIIDELPHLVAACPALPSVLQNWIDHEAKEARVLLVVAGSSQRMMQGIVLDHAAPLFGRATESFELRPLPPGFIGEALGIDDPSEQIRAWAVWGGIPWYWELGSRFGAELATAIEALVLDPSGPLHHEPDRLLTEEQPSAAVLRPLLDAIGAGAHRPSEIAARIGQPVTSLGRPLARLLGLGLARRELPFGESERSSKKALYKLDDPFFRFWFDAVAPRRGALATSTRASRLELARATVRRVVPDAWEALCRRAVPALGARSLGASGPFGPAARFWRAKGPEWDVVALSVDGTEVLLGEAKWLDSEATEKDIERAAGELARKGIPPVESLQGKPVVRAVFVPRVAPTLRRRKLPFAVIDAATVVGAWR